MGTETGVHVAKFESVGDWEVLYIDGESVKQNHIGRVDVVSYIEGLNIGTTESKRVNIPEDVTMNRYPSDIEEIIEDDRWDYDGEAYE